MIILLSPSKSMNMESAPDTDFTQTHFLRQSQALVDRIRTFSKTELMEFMAISEKLAHLNHQRFLNWKRPFSLENAKQAALAFTGDVYDGLDAQSLSADNLNDAQHRIRILSGLYGLLKPLDLIQPYRLEMGRPLKTDTAKNLYEFWKPAITSELNRCAGDVIINLASNEYFKAIDQRTLKKQIISPVFKDAKNGTYKIISFYAKKARGKMARHLILQRPQNINDLLNFQEDGYRYSPEQSTPSKPVFTRPANSI